MQLTLIISLHYIYSVYMTEMSVIFKIEMNFTLMNIYLGSF